ncbi:HlyD family secretion protein, partial [Parabacteroides leei]
MKEGKEIELRSEEVQEVMGQIPAWIVRWGITLLFIVVLALLVGSYFFKYPDVITTEMTLTSRHPVAQIVARTSGKISKLYVTDGEKVKPGALLAIVQNPASTEDAYRLKDILLEHQAEPDRLSELLSGKAEFVLGEMQSVYVGLLTSLHECKNYRELDYYPKKIAAVRDQIDKYSVYYRNQQRQRQVVKEQYGIACKQYERDSSLFFRQVISPFEYETAKNALLQNRYSLEGANAALENMKIQIGQLEESLLDLQLQQAEKESLLLHNYRTAMEELLNVIGSWELNYCLRSPIEGRVTFTKYWNENQFITSGEDVFSVVPEENERLIGRASLPVQRSGKVELSQRVIVRFANFPDQEFGIVNGIVSAISMVPTEDNYMVEIAFPDG